MILPTSQKDKKNFLIELLHKLNIDKNERELYILSLDILSKDEFNVFFDNILTQLTVNGEIHAEIDKKTIAPLSASII